MNAQPPVNNTMRDDLIDRSRENLDASHRTQFRKLAPVIHDWLSSDDVLLIISEINRRIGTFSVENAVISRLITQVTLGLLKPNEFTYAVSQYLPFLSDQQVMLVAETVRDRIFKPIAHAIRGLGIKIDDLTLPPAVKMPSARTMTIEGGLGKIVHPSAPAPVQKTPAQVLQEEQQLRARTMSVEGQITDPVKLAQKAAAEKAQVAAAAAQAQQLHARTMEINGSFAPARQAPKLDAKKMVDITKPGETRGSGASAQTMNIQGSLSPIERAGQAPAPVKAPTPPSVKKPEQKADELETTAPIGLSEVVPQAPQERPSWPAEPEVVHAEPIKPIQPTSDPSLKQSVPIESPKPTPQAPLPTTPLPKAAGAPAPHDITKYHDEHPMVE